MRFGSCTGARRTLGVKTHLVLKAACSAFCYPANTNSKPYSHHYRTVQHSCGLLETIMFQFGFRTYAKTAKLQSSIFFYYFSGVKCGKTFAVIGAESAAGLVPTTNTLYSVCTFSGASLAGPCNKTCAKCNPFLFWIHSFNHCFYIDSPSRVLFKPVISQSYRPERTSEPGGQRKPF